AARRHVRVSGSVNHRTLPLLVKLEDRHGDIRPFDELAIQLRGWLELEAADVFRQQNRQCQHWDVDISFDETDVVAGALLDDALGMRLGRSGRIHKQVHQALAAIPYRLAINLEHIAKLQPAIPAL